MPSSQKTFRVFVSSTFTDLRAERRLLQEKVFPAVKQYCEAHGASFQPVDLRWGVSEASQREHRTMELCLEEIARCQRLSPRPNFIVLLGDRYGWQPVPNKIPSSEMAALQAHLDDDEAKLISEWYREDTNAVPPEYVLQSRGEAYREYKEWQPVEDRLRATLRKAVSQTDFSAEQRVKYVAAATHQEIIRGALQAPDTGIDQADHVFVYQREWEASPVGEESGDYLDLRADESIDYEAQAQLTALKQELRGRLPEDHIYTYQAEWRAGAHFPEGLIEDLAARVYQDLIAVIDQELAKITVSDGLTREKQLQEEVRDRLTRFFTGQEEPRLRITAHLQQRSGRPLAVLGPSGSGKSSLMARALDDAAGGFPGVIVFRFIGATSASTNPLLLLRQVCGEIAGAYDTSLQALLKEGEDEKKLNSSYGLSEIFSRCLNLATADKPLVIFLDALDQLQDQRFDFLPHTLPEHARIVVSALPELAERLSFAESYPLPPMPEADGATLLDAWLAAEKRKFTKGQWNEVIGKFRANGLPLCRFWTERPGPHTVWPHRLGRCSCSASGRARALSARLAAGGPGVAGMSLRSCFTLKFY